MRYVTLKGGPCDGRIENVVDHCDRLQIRPKNCALTGCMDFTEGSLHYYTQSATDPNIFEHVRQGNEPEEPQEHL